jgi:hypothetical protein
MVHLEYACDKIRMGAERKSAHISKDNLRTTAYHEGGHALVAIHTKGALPIHKATIVPRGMALGMVSYLPEADQLNMSREQMLATLDVAMGGRIAEELKFGLAQVTTGAQGDLATATSIARNMVTRYGMSNVIGPVYAPDDEARALAPATRELIDKEVQGMLEVSARAGGAGGWLHACVFARVRVCSLAHALANSLLLFASPLSGRRRPRSAHGLCSTSTAASSTCSRPAFKSTKRSRARRSQKYSKERRCRPPAPRAASSGEGGQGRGAAGALRRVRRSALGAARCIGGRRPAARHGRVSAVSKDSGPLSYG